MRPAEVRIYFDADILGLGKVIAALRSGCTYPGDQGRVIHKRERPPCSVTSPDIDDTVWIRQVTSEGLLIITRDSKIQRRAGELLAVQEHRARMVALASPDARTVWDQLEIFMRQWRAIEQLHSLDGPFIYRASRTTLSKVGLPSDRRAARRGGTTG
ncbi:MAG: hypothetical protein M3133_07600 [Actinomycetota bacterium]|nr:hypothetical protein [Actinomycetota bacterium]